jgi:hypothetical protein
LSGVSLGKLGYWGDMLGAGAAVWAGKGQAKTKWISTTTSKVVAARFKGVMAFAIIDGFIEYQP